MPKLPEPQPLDEALVDLLAARDGHDSVVELEGGRRLRVLNIAWGYDSGDHYAHVTTNTSPSAPGWAIDFFFTNEVISVADADSGQVVWRRPE